MNKDDVLYESMTVNELRDECNRLGLGAGGDKSSLLARIRSAISKAGPDGLVEKFLPSGELTDVYLQKYIWHKDHEENEAECKLCFFRAPLDDVQTMMDHFKTEAHLEKYKKYKEEAKGKTRAPLITLYCEVCDDRYPYNRKKEHVKWPLHMVNKLLTDNDAKPIKVKSAHITEHLQKLNKPDDPVVGIHMISETTYAASYETFAILYVCRVCGIVANRDKNMRGITTLEMVEHLQSNSHKKNFLRQTDRNGFGEVLQFLEHNRGGPNSMNLDEACAEYIKMNAAKYYKDVFKVIKHFDFGKKATETVNADYKLPERAMIQDAVDADRSASVGLKFLVERHFGTGKISHYCSTCNLDLPSDFQKAIDHFSAFPHMKHYMRRGSKDKYYEMWTLIENGKQDDADELVKQYCKNHIDSTTERPTVSMILRGVEDRRQKLNGEVDERAKIQDFLDKDETKVVGVQFLVEKQFSNGDIEYRCSVCKEHMGEDFKYHEVVAHMSSNKHMRTFLRNNYVGEFRMLEEHNKSEYVKKWSEMNDKERHQRQQSYNKRLHEICERFLDPNPRPKVKVVKKHRDEWDKGGRKRGNSGFRLNRVPENKKRRFGFDDEQPGPGFDEGGRGRFRAGPPRGGGGPPRGGGGPPRGGAGNRFNNTQFIDDDHLRFPGRNDGWHTGRGRGGVRGGSGGGNRFNRGGHGDYAGFDDKPGFGRGADYRDDYRRPDGDDFDFNRNSANRGLSRPDFQANTLGNFRGASPRGHVDEGNLEEKMMSRFSTYLAKAMKEMKNELRAQHQHRRQEEPMDESWDVDFDNFGGGNFERTGGYSNGASRGGDKGYGSRGSQGGAGGYWNQSSKSGAKGFGNQASQGGASGFWNQGSKGGAKDFGSQGGTKGFHQSTGRLGNKASWGGFDESFNNDGGFQNERTAGETGRFRQTMGGSERYRQNAMYGQFDEYEEEW
ncbi:uncharacterized protein LOC141904150 isoform X2 [Tubulanus polymorphus]|uniref:uncharacterized protein LOC141904150 isoform X2 n=1 Tax=Tubulanus polymorphus TaxID=672921 RepID=UPI003DA20E2B